VSSVPVLSFIEQQGKSFTLHFHVFFSPGRELIHFLSISREALFVRITAGGKGNRSSVFLSFVTWGVGGGAVRDSAVGKK